ncbi:MAG TPA: Ig-like domain-containing protein, partial [Marmoricola sp.]|nr:Ig-like domain-containing protein [Marmoricola sp.]
MPFPHRLRTSGFAVLTLGLVGLSVISNPVTPASTAAPVTAPDTTQAAARVTVPQVRVRVSSRVQYLGDRAGKAFTFALLNTGTSAIAAVEIDRPKPSWTVAACPAAPKGWSHQRAARTKCRYISKHSSAALAPGSSAAFRIKVRTRPGKRNVSGKWHVLVSRTRQLGQRHPLVATAAVPGGLRITAYAFQVLGVVVDPRTTKPGAACPAPKKTAIAASGQHTFVICGRNRSTTAQTPTAAHAGLAGTFVAVHGRFASGRIVPTRRSRILGSWTGVTVTSSPAGNKTVLAQVGSAARRTSPSTGFTGYRATPGSAESAPIVTSLGSGNVVFTEDGPAVPITTTAAVTDSDSATFSTGRLEAELTNGQPEDRLEVLNQGTGSGQIGLVGANVTLAGTTIGTVAGGSGSTPLVITFNSHATPAAAQALLRDVTYRDVSDAPSTADRMVQVQFADDKGALSASQTRTIQVVAVDDPPVALNDAVTVAQDSAATVVPVLANDTDVDGGPKTIASATDPAHGTVVLTGGTSGANTGLTYQPDAGYCNDGGQPDSFNYMLNGGSEATVSMTVTCTPSNVAPVIAGLEGTALAYTENDPATLITATGTVADTDSADFATGTLTVDFSAGGQAEDRLSISNQGTGAGQIGTSGSDVSFAGTTIGTFTGGSGTTPLVVTFNANATPAVAQALLRAITYADVSDNPSSTARTVRFVVSDGDGGTSAAATRGITVTAVDDPPVAVADAETVSAGAAATAVPVLANDTDVDGGPKTISSATDPAHGTVVLTGGTSGANTGLTYQPDAGYCNDAPALPDTFSYMLNGGSTATVT